MRAALSAQYNLDTEKSYRKIGLLGASLTHQFINHKTQEPTGYSYYLNMLLKSIYPNNYKLRKFTYPGSRFEFGGWFHCKDILDFRPDLLLLEFSVEDGSQKIILGQRQRDYVHFFHILMQHNIFFGCLLLDHALVDPKQNSLILDICEKMKIPAQFVHQKHIESEQVRFEGVHTNAASSKSLLSAWKPFISNMLRLSHSKLSWSAHSLRLSENLGPPNLQYFSVHPICSNEEGVAATDFQIDVTFDSDGSESVDFAIALLSLIGPHSSNISVESLDCSLQNDETTTSLFDQHCYYVRHAIKILALGSTNASSHAMLKFHATNEPPNKSILKKPVQVGASYPLSLVFRKDSRLMFRSSQKVRSCIVTI